MSNKQKIADATWALQQLDVTGNIIPHQWFNSIKMENGSPDFHSIILLSEIVYWYKPKNKFNEKGIQVGITKKYSEDLLQKSYDDLSEKFGMTKRQVRDAIVRLEKRGLVEREFRNLVVRGMAINNVLYIKLFVDKLKEYTLSDMTDSNDGVTDLNTSECSNSSEGVLVQGYTYTETTTKTTTKNKKTSSHKYETCDMENAMLLYQLILENDENAKKPNLEKWANDIRMTRTIDNRTTEQIAYMIKWTQENSFWKSNILSPAKLRKQFSSLVIKMKSEKEQNFKQQQKNISPWRKDAYGETGSSAINDDDRKCLPERVQGGERISLSNILRSTSEL